ncbi:MAG: hypothetical protein WDM96_18275 [Lacunisphaera sp.]
MGVTAMMTHNPDAYGVVLNPKQEVMGKAVEVDATQIALDRMEPGGVFAG